MTGQSVKGSVLHPVPLPHTLPKSTSQHYLQWAGPESPVNCVTGDYAHHAVLQHSTHRYWEEYTVHQPSVTCTQQYSTRTRWIPVGKKHTINLGPQYRWNQHWKDQAGHRMTVTYTRQNGIRQHWIGQAGNLPSGLCTPITLSAYQH